MKKYTVTLTLSVEAEDEEMAMSAFDDEVVNNNYSWANFDVEEEVIED